MGRTRKPRSATRKSTLHRLKVPEGATPKLRSFVRERYLDSDDYQAREFRRLRAMNADVEVVAIRR